MWSVGVASPEVEVPDELEGVAYRDVEKTNRRVSSHLSHSYLTLWFCQS